MSSLEQFLPYVVDHPLHRAMGVERIEAADGRSRIEIDVGGDMVNAAGMFLGGNVYTICDMACYAALLSELPEGHNAVTHDIHVSADAWRPLGRQGDLHRPSDPPRPLRRLHGGGGPCR